ncbi:lysM domain-containing GPI-anchored protein 2 isoform X1 [Hevea brasiliensis]|uniref:lysM domain-containing GPI-anchored protein 2 isoform X1 n=1 Tax=Hevea brasiliensis TaxID=3981 RepID=UPI000B777155|nr:lysM domain-containing GPI-anchored protein 2 isoform X1 [Hevea brasiliensis]
MALPTAHLLLSLMLLFFASLATNSSSQSQPFKCTTSATCHALIDYVSPNTSTLSAIEALFSIKNLRSLLGANNFPLSTLPNQTVAAQQTIKIPFTCLCSNGTGISNKKPTYIVQSGDDLDHIAREVFSGLVTNQQIAAVNNIKNASLIHPRDELWIPLPCSCDEVGGERVVHYGHVVEAGSTLELIAEEYGTTKDTLMSLNSIVNDSSLMAGQVLDVPLKACNSSVIASSLDYPLLVPNGTYVFTANSCMRCNCDSAKNWTLQCQPSQLRPANNTWLTCPSTTLCEGADNLSIGNTTIVGCNQTSCAYSGFNNQTILTTLATVNTCPAISPGPGNNTSKIGLSWKFLFISVHLIMLCLHLLW